MAQRITNKMVSGRKLLLAVAGLAAIGEPILFAAPIPGPVFDVASVKPNTSVNSAGWTRFEPMGINFRRASLLSVISLAYRIPDSLVSSDPRMRDLFAARYDIVARVEREVPRDQLLLMLQALLADRFRLTLHRESKVQPVYKLVVAKGGPKLKPSQGPQPRDANCSAPQCIGFSETEMWSFAAALANRMGRPVVDATGLQGSYDFTLRLDRMDVGNDDPEAKARASDWSLSSIFSDLEKELGLKLESDRAPVEGLVIDHAERPSEN